MQRTAFALCLLLASAIAPPPARAQVEPDGSSPRARAQQRADQLDQLLQQLQGARNEADADAISRQVRRLWMQSGDAEAEDELQEASIYVRQGLLKPALDVLDRLVIRAPAFAEVWFRRASIHYVMNDTGRALSDLDRTIELEPRHFVALITRGQIFIERREWKSALADFRAAVRVHPFLKEALTAIPDLERRAGQRGI